MKKVTQFPITTFERILNSIRSHLSELTRETLATTFNAKSNNRQQIKTEYISLQKKTGNTQKFC